MIVNPGPRTLERIPRAKLDLTRETLDPNEVRPFSRRSLALRRIDRYSVARAGGVYGSHPLRVRDVESFHT